MSLAPFPGLHCTPAHFTCVLTCVWACVPVQRMARDALCAPRVWDAAKPEVIHPRAFTDKRSLRLRFAVPVVGSERSYSYFRPLERCAERSAVCSNTPVPVLPSSSHHHRDSSNTHDTRPSASHERPSQQVHLNRSNAAAGSRASRSASLHPPRGSGCTS